MCGITNANCKTSAKDGNGGAFWLPIISLEHVPALLLIRLSHFVHFLFRLFALGGGIIVTLTCMVATPAIIAGIAAFLKLILVSGVVRVGHAILKTYLRMYYELAYR